MTVVIAGCGDVGTEAGLRFVEAGHSILGLRRSADVLPDSFQKLSIDLSQDSPPLPADTEVVVLITSADRRSVADYETAYLRTTDNMIRAIERDCASPPRVLLVSSTAVWDVNDGSLVDEDVPAAPATPTATVLLQAEQLLTAALPNVVILRLGGIYGPGRGRLIEQARVGAAPATAGPHFTNRIHRDDAAAAIVHLTTSPESIGPVYLGVDDDPAERTDVVRFIAAELGVEPPPAPIGDLATGKRCSNARLRSSGFAFAYPSYREGYRAILTGHGVRHL